MRIAALLVSLVLFPASQLFAEPVLSMLFLNSNLTFGTVNPNQVGWDASSLVVDGDLSDFDYSGTAYEAQTGALDHQTLNVNGVGDVIGSQYLYTGGTFELFFSLDKDGTHAFGSFVAPIVALTITAGEGDGELADASYVLGPGLFDQTIADLLGIGRHTKGGEALAFMLLTDNGGRPGVAGDHSTPERQAWDGGLELTIVPEPATFMLLTAGVGALWTRRRIRR